MHTELRTLIERRVVAPGHLWMIGVPLDEIADPPAGAAEWRTAVDDPVAGECCCPDACGRDHPNE